jgi:hypothetical protein
MDPREYDSATSTNPHDPPPCIERRGFLAARRLEPSLNVTRAADGVRGCWSMPWVV